MGLSGLAMADGPAQQYLGTQLREVRSLQTRVEQIARIADESASRLLAGGRIYAAGQPGSISELVGRAGGLCGIQSLSCDKPPASLGAGDVVLVADYGDGKTKTVAMAEKGPLVVIFAPAGSPLVREPSAATCGRLRSTFLPTTPPERAMTAGRLLPAAAPAVATAQWAFTAELIAACRRRHRQLAVYLSIHLDPGLQRFARKPENLLFEPQVRPEPVAEGRYARQFLGQVGDALQTVEAGELTKIHRAGPIDPPGEGRRASGGPPSRRTPAAARTGPAGRSDCSTALSKADGEAAVKWVRENLHPGDVYLLLGYQRTKTPSRQRPVRPVCTARFSSPRGGLASGNRRTPLISTLILTGR